MTRYALILALLLCTAVGCVGIMFALGALDRLSPYPPSNNTYYIGDY
jgi:hypothetical protein